MDKPKASRFIYAETFVIDINFNASSLSIKYILVQKDMLLRALKPIIFRKEWLEKLLEAGIKIMFVCICLNKLPFIDFLNAVNFLLIFFAEFNQSKVSKEELNKLYGLNNKYLKIFTKCYQIWKC